MITVTQPFLPPIKEFNSYLKQIWESKWLTNNGQFHQQLEKELAEFLGVPYVCLFSNGALALVTALQCLRVSGEVITTPFSFVATTHALWWNNIKPVFADIDPVFGNLDPQKIESAITPQTTAIMPVHVYGNPCENAKIQRIADTYGLKIIYDAAHAFNVKQNNQSILNWGDLSILSFHATKVFNTFEGGAVICKDEKTKKRLDDLKNFGIHDEETVVAPGINAKMNEVQAAMGLLQLRYIDKAIEKRKKITEIYRNELHLTPGIRFLNEINDTVHNYSYFPVFVDENYPFNRNELYDVLKQNGILSRKYFYPLISEFPTYRGLSSAAAENLANSHKLAQQVLCLPIFPDLNYDDLNRIIGIIKENAKK